MSLADTQKTYEVASSYYDDEERRGGLRRKIRFRIIERPMRRLLQQGNCLDLGCGTGRLLREVTSTAPNFGTDLSLPMLRKSNCQRAPLCAADAHHLPFGDASFRSIIASNGVFRYLQQPEAFAECFRVLKPGGRLAVHQYSQTTSTVFGGRGKLRVNERHIASIQDLTAPAENAGFHTETSWLWRPIRFFPFALPIPQVLPGNHWGHAVALFEKGKAN